MSGRGEHPHATGCGVDAAPYVLGALTEQEHAAFSTHLSTCAVCREEVAVLRSGRGGAAAGGSRR